MFPFTPELRAVLDDQRAWVTTIERRTGTIVPWVFPRPDGLPVRSYREMWNAARHASGVNRLVRDFRRTAVRNLERAGVPRSAAMAMVGHKTESINRRNAIVNEAMMQDGAEKLSAFHSQQRQQPSKVTVFSREWPSRDALGGDVEPPFKEERERSSLMPYRSEQERPSRSFLFGASGHHTLYASPSRERPASRGALLVLRVSNDYRCYDRPARNEEVSCTDCTLTQG